MRPVLGLEPATIGGPEDFTVWLRYGVLARWSASGVDYRGRGFHEALDVSGRYVRAPARLRTHARQIYSFATAYRLGWGAGYATPADIGLRGLTAFRRDDGYFADCPQARRFEANLYEQAFVLLAAAAAAAAGIRRDMPTVESEARQFAGQLLASPESGVREPDTGQPAGADACMHLLEALLYWRSVAGTQWDAHVMTVAEDAAARLIDPESGLIVEPSAGEEQLETGGRCEPGHLYEWAVLFDLVSGLKGAKRFSAMARRLLLFAEQHGQGESGYTLNAVAPDGEVLDIGARLWPQCERLKALDHFGRRKNSAAAWAALSRHVDGCQPGLWHERLGPGPYPLRFTPAPATSLYHLMALQSQLHARAEPTLLRAAISQ